MVIERTCVTWVSGRKPDAVRRSARLSRVVRGDFPGSVMDGRRTTESLVVLERQVWVSFV